MGVGIRGTDELHWGLGINVIGVPTGGNGGRD